MHFTAQKINVRKNEAGAIGWALLWLIGIPIPITRLHLMRATVVERVQVIVCCHERPPCAG
jgi:hypothetical protein